MRERDRWRTNYLGDPRQMRTLLGEESDHHHNTHSQAPQALLYTIVYNTVGESTTHTTETEPDIRKSQSHSHPNCFFTPDLTNRQTRIERTRNPATTTTHTTETERGMSESGWKPLDIFQKLIAC